MLGVCGMTYEQYWYGDVTMVSAFLQADRARQKRENEKSWLQGMYIYDAILCASPALRAFSKSKPTPYPDKPYTQRRSEQNARKNEEENERLKAILFFRQWAKANKRGSEPNG